MSKPMAMVRVFPVGDERQKRAVELEAVFDTGSHYTIVRRKDLPPGTPVTRLSRASAWGTAVAGTRLRVVGVTHLVIELGSRRIAVQAWVAPKLSRPLIVGAGAMQEWDISIKNRNGKTRVAVGKDMRDPDLTMVL